MSARAPATLEAVAAATAPLGLVVLGAFHPAAGDAAPPGCGTLVLLGPEGPGFWRIFSASPELRDGRADPLDRWSARVIGALAARFDAAARFPFGGPPHQPFTAWARRSKQAWPSPVGLLVHATAGLFVSYRGALALRPRLPLAPPGARPCDRCPAPCLAACPAGALTGAGYDLAACHGLLDTVAGADCMARGCRVRAACPVGGDLRPAAQSAFHMADFHGRQSTCDG